MKISVTQDHIDAARFLQEDNEARAQIHYSERCPIAMALHTQGFPCAQVRYTSAALDYDRTAEGDRRTPLPVVAQKFIEAWDSTFDVAPFEFELDL